jgi:hypothetical protein
VFVKLTRDLRILSVAAALQDDDGLAMPSAKLSVRRAVHECTKWYQKRLRQFKAYN